MKWKTIYSNDQFCFSGKNGFVKGLLIFFLGLISFSSFCQISIDGVVRDADEESLIGVNVQVKGTFTPIKLSSRSEVHTSELQSRGHLVCRLLLEKKKKNR